LWYFCGRWPSKKGIREGSNGLKDPYYASRLNFNSLVSITFDHLVSWVVHNIPRADLEEWFLAAGLEHIVITSRNHMSWRGQGSLL
jgi:hypothetical protein